LPLSPRGAKLVRYPHYHQGRVVFSYLGDIWTGGEDGRNVQRITAMPRGITYPRFSPDGNGSAFSSDRSGNLDVYIIAAEAARQTAHVPTRPMTTS